MKVILVLLAMTTIAGQAYAFEFNDNVKCAVTICNPDRPVTPGDCQIASWKFKADRGNAIVSYATISGVSAGYPLAAQVFQRPEGMYVFLDLNRTTITGFVPLTCQKGQFNENCVVNSKADGQVEVIQSTKTTYTTRCQSIN
jgi:hypothetical protein